MEVRAAGVKLVVPEHLAHLFDVPCSALLPKNYKITAECSVQILNPKSAAVGPPAAFERLVKRYHNARRDSRAGVSVCE